MPYPSPRWPPFQSRTPASQSDASSRNLARKHEDARTLIRPPTKCTTSIVSPASRTVSDHTGRETISRFRSTATASSSRPSRRIRSPTEAGDASEKGLPLSVTATTSAAPPTAIDPRGIPALYAPTIGVPESARKAGPEPDSRHRNSRAERLAAHRTLTVNAGAERRADRRAAPPCNLGQGLRSVGIPSTSVPG